jgi:hypothetical protein
MNILKIILLVQILFIVLLGCHEDRTSTWPEKAKTSMFIPQKAKNQEYYELKGTYQTAFRTLACWPGEEYIDMMVAYMSKNGWTRLDEDFLNPGLRPSWAIKSSIGEKWGHFVDKSTYFHQWVEDWEDSDKNLVRYWLKYRTKNPAITSDSCDLNAVAIFIPKEVRQKTVQEAEVVKQAEAMKHKTRK